MKHRILIVDDEAPARDELAYLVSDILQDAEIFKASSGEQALKLIREEEIEVAFIDINMPVMDGITLSQEIHKEKPLIKIVFATAYDLYAVKAFELNAIDYILKPFEEERLELTVNKILKGREAKNEEKEAPAKTAVLCADKKLKKLSVWKGDRVILIDIKDIVYIVTDERNTLIKTICGEYYSNQSISQLEGKLTPENFFRVHRSYLINLEHVKEILPWFNNTYVVKMEKYDKDEIPVSRKQIKHFKEFFEF